MEECQNFKAVWKKCMLLCQEYILRGISIQPELENYASKFQVGKEQFSINSRYMHRGFYCPSPVLEYIIINMRRGKIPKRITKATRLTNRYVFDTENKLRIAETFDPNGSASGLCTLDGIDKHRKLKSLVLYNNYGLKDITMLRSVADSLAELVIENSSKIQDFSALDSLVNLEHLQLYGNNVLPNLNFLQKMTRLKTFTFTMNVEDGDLNLCMNLPYASCKNRRHYNLKDSKLPKNLIRRTDDSTLP